MCEPMREKKKTQFMIKGCYQTGEAVEKQGWNLKVVNSSWRCFGVFLFVMKVQSKLDNVKHWLVLLGKYMGVYEADWQDDHPEGCSSSGPELDSILPNAL